MGALLSLNIKTVLCTFKMPHAPLLPPLLPLPHHPMHFRTHRCNNCGDKFHSLVQRSCSKRSWRSSAHWSSEMGTSYGKLTVVVNQKQWLKRRQPQRPTATPARRGLPPPPTLLLLALNLYGGEAHKYGAARMRKIFKGRQISLIRPVCRGLLLFSFANYHFYWQIFLWLFANLVFRNTMRNT